MYRGLTGIVLIIFVASTVYTWVAWPFDAHDARLKVFFATRVELANFTSPVNNHLNEGSKLYSTFTSTQQFTPYTPPEVTRAMTELTALPAYAASIATRLPSSGTNRPVT